MDILVQLALPETTLAARDVVGTVRTPDADCLIWIKGTTSPSSLTATLKQDSHQIKRPQAGTGLIRRPDRSCCSRLSVACKITFLLSRFLCIEWSASPRRSNTA